MMPDFVKNVLVDMGTSGAIIAVLMLVVSTLSGVIVFMYRKSNDVNASRLKEREVLTSALLDTNNTLRGVLEALNERNDLTADIAGSINSHAAQQTFWSEKIKLQYEVMREDHARMAVVVGSLSEALRNISQTTAEIRNAIPYLSGEVRNGVSTLLTTFLNETRSMLSRALHDLEDEARRNR